MFCVESLISCILLLVGAFLHEHTLEFINFGTNQIEKSSKELDLKKIVLKFMKQSILSKYTPTGKRGIFGMS